MYTCRISVHELVEASYLQGDLSSQGKSVTRAQQGSRIHRLLQSQRPKGYQSEVFFRHATTLEDISIIVEGRADGIYGEQDPVILEEIKSTLLPYEQIDDTNFVHFAQCFVYGYFYLLERKELDAIICRVTYCQVQSEKIKYFDITKTRAELQQFYEELIDHYRKWALLQRDLHIEAKTSAKSVQ